jgi:hypothetical protein
VTSGRKQACAERTLRRRISGNRGSRPRPRTAARLRGSLSISGCAARHQPRGQGRVAVRITRPNSPSRKPQSIRCARRTRGWLHPFSHLRIRPRLRPRMREILQENRPKMPTGLQTRVQKTAGAEIGTTMVLHTWGDAHASSASQLHRAGRRIVAQRRGLDRVPARGFFLPVRALSRFYRRPDHHPLARQMLWKWFARAFWVCQVLR